MRVAAWLSAITMLGAGGCAAWSLPDHPLLPSYSVEQKIFPLKSGMRVVVQPDHSAPQVAVAWAVGAGSTSDPSGVEGLAHMVEHLAFRTRPGGGSQVWDQLKRMGASFNASTGPDLTSYYTIFHKRFLQRVLQIDAWRMARTLDGVSQEIVDIEREVVRNELRQRGETTIGSRLFDVLLGTAFPEGHPLARPIGGTHESLSAIRFANARGFVRRHYRPDNITFVVAGDVDPDEVARLIGMWPPELLFGPEGEKGAAVPPQAPLNARPAPEVPAPVTTSLKRERGPIAEPILLLAWAGPPGHRGNDAMLSAAADRMNMALFSGVERKEGDDLQGMGASVMPFKDASIFMVEATLKPGADPERERKRLLDAVGNAKATQQDDSVGLNRMVTEGARWDRATSLLLQAADPLEGGIAIADFAATTGKTALFSERFHEVASVSMNEVSALLDRWLDRERVVSVYFEPESDRMPELAAGGGGGRAQKHDIARGEEQQTLDLTPQELIAIAGSPGLTSLDRRKMPNGLEIIARRTSRIPFAQVSVHLPGGDATTQPYGFASYARGLSRQTCYEHGDLSAVSGSLYGGGGEVSGAIYGHAPSGNLVNVMAVLSDYVGCRGLNEEAFLFRNEQMKERLERYQRRKKQPESIAHEKLMAGLYPDHPYGRSSISPDAFSQVTEADVTAFLRSHFRPDQATLIAVGDVESAAVNALADQYLSGWAAGGSTGLSTPPPAPFPTERRTFLIDRPKATQASVTVACRLEHATPQTVPLYDLAEAIADELGWKIREEWGATYGIHADVATRSGGSSHLLMRGAVVSSEAARAVAQLLQIIDTLASDHLPDSVFRQKRLDVAIQFSTRFLGSDGLTLAVLSARRQGWPYDVWDHYGQHLAEATPDGIRKLLKPCVGREVVTVVGDAKALRSQLAGVGVVLAP